MRLEPIVLRVYEHDPSLCRKELDLLGLVRQRVFVPELIHAEPDGLEGIPPFALFRFVDGITFRHQKRTADIDVIHRAAFAVGQTLAAISRFTFARPGWLGPGLEVTAPLLEGDNPAPRFVDACISSGNFERHVEASIRDQVRILIWSNASRLATLHQETHLVHGDFGKRNLLMRLDAGKPSVAAVLDWEFAVSGSPLIDIGHFLRYESAARPQLEPHFSRGFSDAGGQLPLDWRQLARLLDLLALCESLTHADLREDVVGELVEIVRATIEERDPKIA
jgi:fructokinase